MIICHMVLSVDLYDIDGLKGRRKIVNSIKDRLKPLNLSLLDISGSYSKEAELALVFLAPNQAFSAQYRQKIEDILNRYLPEYEFNISYEEI
ncbi:MAG: DUF503 family protein [Arcobacteraceae bacterium]|nr:DUF503 family protein [Arcobacteraceae bacterium]MDY0364381.1 DUF503 family protein [Arcobacteraceae bacterium]